MMMPLPQPNEEKQAKPNLKIILVKQKDGWVCLSDDDDEEESVYNIMPTSQIKELEQTAQDKDHEIRRKFGGAGADADAGVRAESNSGTSGSMSLSPSGRIRKYKTLSGLESCNNKNGRFEDALIGRGGSRCNITNGRENGKKWRCSQQKREGFSCCDHHLRLQRKSREGRHLPDSVSRSLKQGGLRCTFKGGSGCRCSRAAREGRSHCDYHIQVNRRAVAKNQQKRKSKSVNFAVPSPTYSADGEEVRQKKPKETEMNIVSVKVSPYS